MTGPCRVRSCLKCNLINFLLHRKSPQSILQGQSKVSPFQKGQLTLAPKLRLTDRILGDWSRSFSNPDPLPTWGRVRVGRTPGMASLTPESGVWGTFLCTLAEPKSRPDPPEVQAGCGSNKEAGPVCIIPAVTGPRHSVSFCLGDPFHRLWVY